MQARLLENKRKRSTSSAEHVARKSTLQRKKNETGLPDNLKSGIENLSGYSMDDVKVHYNSSRPAQLSAHAYAQGNQIHLATGQERHLPHEAWHVVQQKQGRVQPTLQMKSGVKINDDQGLEREADLMGLKSSILQPRSGKLKEISLPVSNPVIQGVWVYIQGESKKSQMIANKDGTYSFGGKVYEYSHTFGGDTYVKPQQTQTTAHKELRYDTYAPYKTGVKGQTHTVVKAPMGTGNISYRYNQGGMYVQSNQQDWGGNTAPDDYVGLIEQMKGDSLSDKEIATKLLDQDDSGMDDKQAHAAAKLLGIVYIAEEWRKQGAAKLFRSYLRMVSKGDASFKDVAKYFRFAQPSGGADMGRRQVGRFMDVRDKNVDQSKFGDKDQKVWDNMSQMDDEDMESTVSRQDEKELKTKIRNYSDKFSGKGFDDKPHWQQQ